MWLILFRIANYLSFQVESFFKWNFVQLKYTSWTKAQLICFKSEHDQPFYVLQKYSVSFSTWGTQALREQLLERINEDTLSINLGREPVWFKEKVSIY